MILKIEQSKYYGYQGKTKELFKKKYRGLKLKWMTDVKLGDDIVDGWMNDDKTEYLLKLPEEGEFKRFTGNSIRMFEFLKTHGAIEVEGEEKGCHIDYNDSKGFLTQIDRFGTFIGADLMNHYRVEEILKNFPENWGVKWSDKNISMSINDVNSKVYPSLDDLNKEMNEIANINKLKVLEIMQPKKKVVRRIIRRIKK